MNVDWLLGFVMLMVGFCGYRVHQFREAGWTGHYYYGIFCIVFTAVVFAVVPR